MKILTTTIARIIFSIPFLIFGLNHLMKADMMAGMVPSFLPGGVLWVYLSGAMLVSAAVCFIIGKYLREAGFAIAAFLLITIITIHIPGMSNPQMQMIAFSGLMKDTGLIGGALLIAGMGQAKASKI